MPSKRVNSKQIVPRFARADGDALRSGLRWGLAAVVGVACLADPAAAQSLPETPTRPVFGPMLSFVGALLVNLVLGGIVVAVAPEYSRAIVDRIRSQPAESLLFGILTYIAVVVAAVLLAITIIGIVVVVPGIFVLAFVGVAANVLAMVTVGAVIAESSRSSTLWRSLVVGAVVVSLLASVPGLGDLVNFVLGTLGMGAIAGRYWDGR